MAVRFVTTIAAVFILATASLTASAQSIDFEGLRNNEAVQNFYAGGTGSLASGPGPNFGISFANNASALIRNNAGGGGNFRNNPSGVTVMGFLSGVGAFMNVPAGFSNGFSFFYATTQAGSIRVFSGLNGTGTLLATLPLPANNTGAICNADLPAAFFCNWSPTGVTFAGTAMSIDFGGTANQIGFDNITINSAIPVGAVAAVPSIPVPALDELGLLMLALLTAVGGGLALRRKHG